MLQDDEIERHRPRIYGISFAFLTQRVAYHTINELKRRFPEMLIVAGGPHPTSVPEMVMSESAADMVCIGEGELTLTDIVNEVIYGRDDFSQIPGLLLRTPEGTKRSGNPRAIENLDELPYMAWDRIDFSKFVGQHYCKSDRQSCIVISRGCPYKCTFCSLPVWRAAKPYVRMRTAEHIAGEVEWLYKLGVREIKIVSDEINVTLPWAKDVCRAIGELGHEDLFFQSNLRADKMDDELAHLFKRMNMWLVHLGVESANDRVLDGIEKKITVEQTERCLKFLKKHKHSRAAVYDGVPTLGAQGRAAASRRSKEIRRSLLVDVEAVSSCGRMELHDLVDRHADARGAASRHCRTSWASLV